MRGVREHKVSTDLKKKFTRNCMDKIACRALQALGALTIQRYMIYGTNETVGFKAFKTTKC